MEPTLDLQLGFARNLHGEAPAGFAPTRLPIECDSSQTLARSGGLELVKRRSEGIEVVSSGALD